jgi:VWFA-related protein
MLAATQVLAQTPAPARQPTPAPPAQQQPPQPSQTPTPEDDSDDDVVRITSNLVQFDAVVTDKQGRHVADLRPEEFEVFVDGRRQEITNFTFVAGEPEAVRTAQPVARSNDKSVPVPLPPVPLRAGQVRRTIALVADDLGTSFEDIYGVRRALKKFVDEQMQPGDLVAIMRTSAGVGALQQFTTDKQLLYRAIERVRWTPQGRAGISTFAPIEPSPTSNIGSMTGGQASGDRKGAGGEEENDDPRDALEEFREGVFTVGTLGALSFIVRGMKELPGRKSVVVFSGGFQIFRDLNQPNDRRGSDRILDNLRRLTDQANRASVVIYTMDARGLVAPNLTAADNYYPAPGSDPMSSPVFERQQEIVRNQEGLAYLAEQTGGIFIRNTNDLAGGMERILDDQKGFYLIGFRPSEDVFEPLKGKTRFNKFEVKLRRAGLSIRTRAGFYGFLETKRPAPRTRNEQLLAALTTPVTSGELTLRLTSLFSSPNEKTAVVDSLMHIDANQLRLTDEADGWKKAVIDVAAITFGEDGQAVDEINRTETVRARGEALQLMLSEGLVYMMKVPIKKPGAYQLRVAVRDSQTNKVGSASQFIEVPDLKKQRLALSGIVISAAYDEPAPGSAAKPPAAAGRDPLRDATVRRFRRGSQIDFLYQIYNAKVDRTTGRPRLSTQARILRDGQPVFTGPPALYDPGPQTDMTRLKAGSRLQLGMNLPPGDYVLQLIVTDELAKGSRANATQWLDFEIVK